MARILICHVPKDGATARELGAALMGRGHFVSFDGEPDTPRADRATRLRQFEAVVVVWTETSGQNAGLSDIARETLPLNALVPVRAEELDKAKLPLAFRKLNMFAPRDVDGIARLVARLSTAATSLRNMAAGSARLADTREERRAERPARTRPAETPPAAVPARTARPPVIDVGATATARPLLDLPEVPDPRADPALEPSVEAAAAPSRGEGLEAALNPHRDAPPPPVTAADLARAVDAGLLGFHIPETMWLGEPVVVEITIGQDALAELLAADARPGDGPTAEHAGIETLSVSLYGHADVFEIERQTERTQAVSAIQVQAGHRGEAAPGRWAWIVTPQSGGPQDLIVRISALLRDRNGVPEPVAVPDRRFRTVIDVPEGADILPGLVGWQRGR